MPLIDTVNNTLYWDGVNYFWLPYVYADKVYNSVAFATDKETTITIKDLISIVPLVSSRFSSLKLYSDLPISVVEYSKRCFLIEGVHPKPKSAGVLSLLWVLCFSYYGSEEIATRLVGYSRRLLKDKKFPSSIELFEYIKENYNEEASKSRSKKLKESKNKVYKDHKGNVYNSLKDITEAYGIERWLLMYRYKRYEQGKISLEDVFKSTKTQQVVAEWGDTKTNIAKRFGVSLDLLKDYFDLSNSLEELEEYAEAIRKRVSLQESSKAWFSSLAGHEKVVGVFKDSSLIDETICDTYLTLDTPIQLLGGGEGFITESEGNFYLNGNEYQFKDVMGILTTRLEGLVIDGNGYYNIVTDIYSKFISNHISDLSKISDWFLQLYISEDVPKVLYKQSDFNKYVIDLQLARTKKVTDLTSLKEIGITPVLNKHTSSYSNAKRKFKGLNISENYVMFDNEDATLRFSMPISLVEKVKRGSNSFPIISKGVLSQTEYPSSLIVYLYMALASKSFIVRPNVKNHSKLDFRVILKLNNTRLNLVSVYYSDRENIMSTFNNWVKELNALFSTYNLPKLNLILTFPED